MVEAARPVILLVKLPVPVPSDVLVLNATVAPELVLQQTPRAVMADPPSEVVTPPETADVVPIDVITLVKSTGTVGVVTGAEVVNETSFPYEVPIEFTA